MTDARERYVREAAAISAALPLPLPTPSTIHTNTYTYDFSSSPFTFTHPTNNVNYQVTMIKVMEMEKDGNRSVGVEVWGKRVRKDGTVDRKNWNPRILPLGYEVSELILAEHYRGQKEG